MFRIIFYYISSGRRCFIDSSNSSWLTSWTIRTRHHSPLSDWSNIISIYSWIRIKFLWSYLFYPCMNNFNDSHWRWNNMQHAVATWYHKFNPAWHTDTEAYYMWQAHTPNADNPAGLAAMEKRELSLSHTEWLMSSSYDLASYGHPTSQGTFAGSFMRLTAGTLEGRATIALEGSHAFDAHLAASRFDPSRFVSMAAASLDGTVDQVSAIVLW